MKFSIAFIKNFAWFSIVVATMHFLGESYYTFLNGQSLIQCLIDFIAVILMIFGSFVLLKNNNSRGILCGAWGFTFCLNFRAWAWRFETNHNKEITENIDAMTAILAFLLLVSFFSFIVSITMNLPKNNFIK